MCNICKKKEAIVHYAEIIEGQMKKMDLCESCAVDKGVGTTLSSSVTDLLTGFTAEWEPTTEIKDRETCPLCKMTYLDFKKTGRLGCSQCYKTFSRSLNPLLETIHHSTRHTGKTPFKSEQVADQADKLKKLGEELHTAVMNEEFEKAAMVRDEIRKLEMEIKGKKKNKKEEPA